MALHAQAPEIPKVSLTHNKKNMQDSKVLADLEKKVAVMENEQGHLDEARKTLESRIFEEFAKTNALIAKSASDLAARIDKVETGLGTRIDKLEEKVSSVN